ncbi:hypothetical protein DERF_011992 [Dermatophagoides farinae]|uniref:Uncharacterized protein n=1 Tax=Dermatophagoides farinae TaxID=6954 RepID=A0A922L1A5_DERFA|nr:hypothetical protein DERF_011992 [Dermatophagoides farinae]
MAFRTFYFTIILVTILIIFNYHSVMGINLNYEDCGLHNVYSVNVDGCDDQLSSNDECVIVDKNSITYYLTFASATTSSKFFNNETFLQSGTENITNIVGDLCQNPSKYNIEKCPIEANHIYRINKSINYMNQFALNYQLTLEDKYFSNADSRQNPQLLACSRIRLRYYDNRYTTTARPDNRTTNRPDDQYREWLEILTSVLRQSEELANKTETKLRQHYPHQNSSNPNHILRTVETQLIQLRIDVTGIWIEIRHRIMRSDEMREFRLFVERSSDTLWKHGEQLRLTIDILDEFGWDFHDQSNEWIRKQITPILEQLLQRLRSMYGYLELHHTEGNDPTKINEFIQYKSGHKSKPFNRRYLYYYLYRFDRDVIMTKSSNINMTMFFMAIICYIVAIVSSFSIPTDIQDKNSTFDSYLTIAVAKYEQAHQRLKETQLNAYNNIMTESLDYFKILIKRAKSYKQYLNHPFMQKLVDYTIKDLDKMNTFIQLLIKLYDQGNDLTMPILSDLIDQLIQQSGIDVGYLSSLENATATKDAQHISHLSNMMRKDLHTLKQLNLYSNTKEVQELVKKLIQEMSTFQNTVLEAEKRWNINSVTLSFT